MTTRDELVRALAGRYAVGSRGDRGRMLDEFAALTGHHRKHAPARAPGERRHQLRYGFGKGLTRTSGVAAVEPTYAQADPDHTPERWQVSRAPAIAAVHGPAHRAAVRAAATAIHATGSDLKMGQSISRHLLNPASRDRPLNVHALFNGEACRRHQSLLPSRYNPRKVMWTALKRQCLFVPPQHSLASRRPAGRRWRLPGMGLFPLSR